MASEQPSIEELLAGPLREVLADFRRKWQEFQGEEPFWSVLQGFINAIDWTDPWIIALCTAHATLVLLAILTRKSFHVQTTIFAAAMTLVYMGERVNKLAAQEWQRFSRQNYFDPQGTFYSAVVSGPLLLVMFIVLINYLRSCTSLLIKAKRLELKHKAKARRRQEQDQQTAGGGGGQQGPGESKKDT